MIEFRKTSLFAHFEDAVGKRVDREQQVRVDPLTLRTCRITPSRELEKERGTERLHSPPDTDLDTTNCPFCPGNMAAQTPHLTPEISPSGKLTRNASVLFPNLYPYTEWSAVSLFDRQHHVEIGMAKVASYRDSFCNCADYLSRVSRYDQEAKYMAITQNHLPGAGGSLVHPHLQVHATARVTHNHLLLGERIRSYHHEHGKDLISEILSAEQKEKERYIGTTGIWHWLVAFAPRGFYEIWGIAPDQFTLLAPEKTGLWEDLARGVLNTQRLYRSLNRNAYNLSLISTEDGEDLPCLLVSLTARSSYAPWVRSDFTGFEFASGEMATFSFPEWLAEKARSFW
ncbi:MAG: hypothetical protein QNJ17_13185 [Desulfocapsaceae bacterium]|nr:hypothetical protein [Desulfocapsaceae bacterium]